jgi:hypothetical protein
VGRHLDYSGVRVKQVCPFVLRDDENGAARELDWGSDDVGNTHLRIRPMQRVMHKDTLQESFAFFGSRAPRRLPILDKCQYIPRKLTHGMKGQPYRTEVATLTAYGA